MDVDAVSVALCSSSRCLPRRRRSGSKSSSRPTAKKKNAARKRSPPTPGPSNSRSRSRRRKSRSKKPKKKASRRPAAAFRSASPTSRSRASAATPKRSRRPAPDTSEPTSRRASQPTRSRSPAARSRNSAAAPLAAEGLFEEPGPECEESEIGFQEATIYTGKIGEGGAGDVPVEGLVYDLVPSESEHMSQRPAPRLAVRRRGRTAEIPDGRRAESTLRSRTDSRRSVPRQQSRKRSSEKSDGRSPDQKTVVLALADQRQRRMGQRSTRDRRRRLPRLLRNRSGRIASAAALASHVRRPGRRRRLHHERDELPGAPDDDPDARRQEHRAAGSNGRECEDQLHDPDRPDRAATCSNSRSTSRFHPATTTTDQPNEFTAEATEEHEPESKSTARRSNRPNSCCRPA